MRDAMQFLGTFARNPRSVGAVLPSSRSLALALAGDLDPQPGDLVLEFGPGTGPVTQVIAERMTEGAHYLGIERDPGFVRRLRDRFPGLRFHEGSVESVDRVLREQGLPAPRWIISGLPFASLPEPVQNLLVAGDVTAKLVADFLDVGLVECEAGDPGLSIDGYLVEVE